MINNVEAEVRLIDPTPFRLCVDFVKFKKRAHAIHSRTGAESMQKMLIDVEQSQSTPCFTK
jgi:hypothetical protein